MTNHGVADSPALPKHIPQLDGLRGIAITSVMLFHWHIPGFNIGWAGVQLFFVISGFLITGILLDTKTNLHYFRNFYARRFLRIFPIYYLALAVVVVIALVFGWQIGDTWYYVFYIQNHYLALTNWRVHFPPMFDHTWSLAIEEQFYFFWPLIVYILDIRKLKVATILLYALALLTRAVLLFSTHNPNLQLLLLPTQADALAAGAFLAILAREQNAYRRLSKWSPGVLLVSGMVLLALILNTGYDVFWSTSGWANSRLNLVLFSFMAIFFGSLISSSIFSSSVLKSVLGLRWLRGIGKISYGLYLYHYPIYVAADLIEFKLVNGKPGLLYYLTEVILTIGLTYLLAISSWKWIETPILKYKDRYI